MELLQITIRGTTPLLMHNPRGSMTVAGSPQVSRKTIPTPEEEAERSTYRLPSGDLCVPAVALRNSILAATSGRRINKKAARPFFAAALLPADEMFPLVDAEGDPLHDYEIDTQRAVVQRQGIMRSRAKIAPPWFVVGTYRFIRETGVSEDMIQDVGIEAGQTVGLLDYRPQKTGWYGCYTIEAIEVVGD